MRLTAHISASQTAAEPPDIGRVFEQHAPFVRALARQLLQREADADDATQEVFVLAWRKLSNFQGNGMRTWLAMITVKTVAAMRRRVWLRNRLGLEAVQEPQIEPQTPASALELQEAKAIFDAAASKLSPKKRVVLVLSDIHGFTGPEVADAVGCPLETVYSRLFHARRELVHHLAEAGHGSPEMVERARSGRLHATGGPLP